MYFLLSFLPIIALYFEKSMELYQCHLNTNQVSLLYEGRIFKLKCPNKKESTMLYFVDFSKYNALINKKNIESKCFNRKK